MQASSTGAGPTHGLAGRPLLGAASLPLLLPRYRVQDIDTIDDWTRAERLFQVQLTQDPEDLAG